MSTQTATVAPMSLTREFFQQTAQPIEITIDGRPTLANHKEFSTGSLGWFASGKIQVKVGGLLVSVQIGLNLTIIGSKELPKV